MANTDNPLTSAYSVIGCLRFPPLSCATFGRSKEVEYLDDRNIIRTTLVECPVSEEEQTEMRMRAETQQQTEMKKEAAMKKQVESEKRKSDSKKAEADAKKAEKAERRRIALGQKKASDQIQAQQTKNVAQAPDLGYDHNLFGEDSLGYVVVGDLDVAAELEKDFPEEGATTQVLKAPDAAPRSVNLSKPKLAASSASRVKKATKKSVSFASTEDVTQAAATAETIESLSDVNKNHCTQPDPGLIKAVLGDIGQGFQKDVNSLSKKAPTKATVKRAPKVLKNPRPKSTAMLDTLLKEMDKNPDVRPLPFNGWEVLSAVQDHPFHGPSASMRRYIHCDGTVESVISGVNPEFPANAAQLDTKSLVEECRTKVNTPYLVEVDDFDGEEIWEPLRLYDTVVDITSSRMVVYQHPDGCLDIVRTGIINVKPSPDPKEVRRQIKAIELQQKAGILPTLPTPPQSSPPQSSTTGSPDLKETPSRKRKSGDDEVDVSQTKKKKTNHAPEDEVARPKAVPRTSRSTKSAPKRKAEDDVTNEETKRQKIDQNAGDAPFTPKATPRIKITATGAKGSRKHSLNTTNQDAAASSSTISTTADLPKENGPADKSDEPIKKMKALLPKLNARVFNEAFEDDASSSDDSSDSIDDEMEKKPIAPRPQKQATGAKRGVSATKSNLASVNYGDGIALDFGKEPSFSVSGKKRPRRDDDIADNGEASTPAQRSKRARRA